MQNIPTRLNFYTCVHQSGRGKRRIQCECLLEFRVLDIRERGEDLQVLKYILLYIARCTRGNC